MSIDRITYTAFVVALLGGLFGIGSASAESMDCSRSEERMGLPPADILTVTNDRQLLQWKDVHNISSKNPEFDGIVATLYEHDDHIRGTGTHVGYEMYPLKSGEVLWIKYEGVHSTTMKGEVWEITFQGVSHFIAGTGKYKAIRGVAHYHGKNSAAGLTADVFCEAVY